MDRFAELLNRLSTCAERNGKLKLLSSYFREAPDPDRGLALAVLTDNLPVSFPMRRVLADLIPRRADPVLYKLSRDYVGDTAETVALIWQPEPRVRWNDLSLNAILTHFQSAKPKDMADILETALDNLDANGRFALLKFLGGALRVGVSARLAKTALAQAYGVDVGIIEEVWHALTPPYAALFTWLEGAGPKPDAGEAPFYRPVMLAHAIEDNDWQNFAPHEIAAEWKWDGIRVQIASTATEAKLFSRQGDDISATFPEIIQAFAKTRGVLDGELLVRRDGAIQPFNQLQQRLNRKTVTAKMRAQYPAHVRLYDILYDDKTDVRALTFDARRQRLENWFTREQPAYADLSSLVPVESFEALRALWSTTRHEGIEGLMLKRRASPYLAGRPKGHWFKWKRAPLTMDCVLIYAQRGAGRRASLHSDFTFGCWKGAELVPVGKANFGFTDAELKQLDKFIRENTVERFGPVRVVKPELVLEVAFDAVNASNRHKSGVAMRFPRIHRIRWDKPAQEADKLETLIGLIDKN